MSKKVKISREELSGKIVAITNQKDFDKVMKVARKFNIQELSSYDNIINWRDKYVDGFFARLKLNGKIGVDSLEYFDYDVPVHEVTVKKFKKYRPIVIPITEDHIVVEDVLPEEVEAFINEAPTVETKYRPYNIHEVGTFVGRSYRDKKTGYMDTIEYISNKNNEVYIDCSTPNQFLRDYVWEDGTPCGMPVGE